MGKEIPSPTTKKERIKLKLHDLELDLRRTMTDNEHNQNIIGHQADEGSTEA